MWGTKQGGGEKGGREGGHPVSPVAFCGGIHNTGSLSRGSEFRG